MSIYKHAPVPIYAYIYTHVQTVLYWTWSVDSHNSIHPVGLAVDTTCPHMCHIVSSHSYLSILIRPAPATTPYDRGMKLNFEEV